MPEPQDETTLEEEYVGEEDDTFRGGRIIGAHRYGIVFVLALAVLMLFSAAGEQTWVRVLASSLGTGILILAVLTGGTHRGLRRMGVALAVLALASALLSLIGTADDVRAVTAVSGAAVTMLSIVAIAKGVGRQPVVNTHTVFAALSTYILLGLFFSWVYAAIGGFDDAPFFAGGRTESIEHYTYFSFITMATVGYGDFVADTGYGRTAAILEALTGQLYLVTVVALIVSNIGRSTRPRARGSESLSKQPQ